jgi:hypothetical protein
MDDHRTRSGRRLIRLAAAECWVAAGAELEGQELEDDEEAGKGR